MKMFVFYFAAFFIDPNSGEYIPVTNSFVYKNQEECRSAELLVIGKNEVNNCLKKTHHHSSNNPLEIEAAILKKMATEFSSRRSSNN